MPILSALQPKPGAANTCVAPTRTVRQSAPLTVDGACQWLAHQHEDLIDSCLTVMPDATLSALGLAFAPSRLDPSLLQLKTGIERACKRRYQHAVGKLSPHADAAAHSAHLSQAVLFSRHHRLDTQVRATYADCMQSPTFEGKQDVAREHAVWLVAIAQAYDVMPPEGRRRAQGLRRSNRISPEVFADASADRVRRGEKMGMLLAMCPPDWRTTYYGHALAAIGCAFVGEMAQSADHFLAAHALGDATAFGFDRTPQAEAFGSVRLLRGQSKLLTVMRATAFVTNSGALYALFAQQLTAAQAPLLTAAWENAADVAEAAFRGHQDILAATMRVRRRIYRYDIPVIMGEAQRAMMAPELLHANVSPDALRAWQGNVSACIRLLDDARMG